jgi:hypothetical protein
MEQLASKIIARTGERLLIGKTSWRDRSVKSWITNIDPADAQRWAARELYPDAAGSAAADYPAGGGAGTESKKGTLLIINQ